MTRKQTMKLLTMLLVCIIILNFIAQPKAEAIGGSLALALGGTSAAKAFLAFIMSCVAMGVTYVTVDDAISAYNDYKENASLSIEDLRYFQKETWTGNYEAVANDLTDIHSGIKSWLTGIFGTIQSGENTLNTELPANIVSANYSYSETYIVPTPTNLNKLNNWDYATKIIHHRVIYKGYLWQIYSITMFTTQTTVLSRKYLLNEDLNQQYQIGSNYFYEFQTLTNEQKTQTIVISTTDNAINGKTVSTIGPRTEALNPTPSLSLNITTDAPILNPSYSPQNRTFPPAPYLPYINPGNEKVSQSISAAGGTMEVYNGTYDQYLDDVVDNASWEDIQGVISGSVPTTTLTETSEGLIIGESSVGIPYPNPDTTAPGEVLTGLGGIMGLLQGITNWIAQLWQLISGIFAIPEGLALDFSSLRLVNFKDKFPFSIPWDIYRAVAVFAKSPETPDFSIDIETDYLNIDHTINLAPIDLPLRFARYVMTIFFIFFLASKTRDLIKW